jgi:phage head maturation protease
VKFDKFALTTGSVELVKVICEKPTALVAVSAVTLPAYVYPEVSSVEENVVDPETVEVVNVQKSPLVCVPT